MISGWGGGSSAVMLLNRISAVMLVMLLNLTGGVEWALKPPVALVHKTTYAPMIDKALSVILLMRVAAHFKSITHGAV